MKKLITRLMAVVAILLLSAWSVNGQTYLTISGETTVELTKTNIQSLDYLSVTTDSWATAKTYCSITGDFYNLSSVGRILNIDVSNVASFDLYVSNSNAGRTFTVTVGSGSPQSITHPGGNCQSFTIPTENAGDVRIKIEGGGSSVYPSKIVLYSPSSPSISAFNAAGVDATIDQTAKTITAELPAGTSLTALTPTVTTGGTATAYSPEGAQDFSVPVVYTVTDGTPANDVSYTVTLTVSVTLSPENDISELTIGTFSPLFNSETNSYSQVLPKASSLAQAVTFTIPAAATANFTSGDTHDFTTPLSITVTAQDASTKVYTIAATVGTKNIAYVTSKGNDDPYLHASLVSKGFYVEDVIAANEAVSFFDNFDLAILFDVVSSSNATALNMAGLINTKRFLNLKAFMYGKTGWPTGAGANFAGARVANVLTNYIAHPIFAGLTFSDSEITLVDAGVTGNGLQGVTTLGSGASIATMLDNPAASCIIEDNTTENAMYLMIGLANGGATNGLSNISANGKMLLDNAVNYLLGDSKFVPTPTSLDRSKVSNLTFDGQTIQNPSNLDLQVFDITGRNVISSNRNIDMSAQAKGIYIVKSTLGLLKIAFTK